MSDKLLWIGKAFGYLILVLMAIFLITCLVVGTLGLWHLAFGWPA